MSAGLRVRRRLGRLGLVPILIAGALGLSNGLGATPSLRAEAGRLDPVSQLGGPTNAVDWQDGRVYTSVGPRVLMLDGCDPAWPIELAQSRPLGGVVQHLAVRDGLVYVAAGRGGLVVLDARADLRQIGQLALEGVAAKVVLQDRYAYVAAGAAGMSVIDVQDPAGPRLIGRFVDARGDAVIATDLAIAGSFAYVVSRNLMQVDLRDPAKPELARKIEDWADAVATEGDRLYVATSEQRAGGERFGHLRVYDLSVDQRPPRLLASVEVGDRARRLAVADGLAFHQGTSRVIAWRFSEPRGLERLGAVASPDSVLNLDPGDRWLWLAAGPSGLRAARFYPWDRIEGQALREVWTSLPAPERVIVDDRDPARIYVADAGVEGGWGPPPRILVLTIPAPTEGSAPGSSGPPDAPRILGSIPAELDKGGFAVHRGFLFLGAPGEILRVIDVREPASAREVARLAMPPDPVSGRRAPVWRIAIEDDLAYLANDEWVRVLDVSDPTAPRQVSAWRSSGGATDLAVRDRRAYVLGPATGIRTNQPSLQIVDFFELGSPLAFASLGTIGFRAGIQAEPGQVFIDGLQVVDVSDPDAPVETALVQLDGRTRDIDQAGGFVYLARAKPDGTGEVRAFDLRMPGRPIETARLDLVDEARDVALGADLAFVAAQGSGLVIAASGLDPAPTLPIPTPTVRTPLPQRAFLPIVARGGLGRCP
ncbi:MAG: PQQ-binding-like beta-propeller repeat protein [Caldilineae bacterium]|nr:PQQ-binding-like beta-propeller repeat protein [Caldilineae bacterium]